jgi:hypothetical protein
MTTPQNILYELHYKLKSLTNMLEGESDGEVQNIYDMVKSVEIEVTEFNERMETLEDKMDLIIKLLSK